MCFYFTLEFRIYLESSSAFGGIKICPCWICYECIHRCGSRSADNAELACLSYKFSISFPHFPKQKKENNAAYDGFKIPTKKTKIKTVWVTSRLPCFLLHVEFANIINTFNLASQIAIGFARICSKFFTRIRPVVTNGLTRCIFAGERFNKPMSHLLFGCHQRV